MKLRYVETIWISALSVDRRVQPALKHLKWIRDDRNGHVTFINLNRFLLLSRSSKWS